MNREIAENIAGITRTTYAWRVDTWPRVDGDEPLEPPGTVVEGPSGAPDDLLQRLRAGEGKRFRLLDGDDLVYCKGRLLVSDAQAYGYDPEFGPLDDYGTPGLGCVTVEYWEKDPKTGTYGWVAL